MNGVGCVGVFGGLYVIEIRSELMFELSCVGILCVMCMQVIFVVGCDSMLFNLCGVYVLYFMCNFVIFDDSSGYMGVGEVLGGEGICYVFECMMDFVVGQLIGCYQVMFNVVCVVLFGVGVGVGCMICYEVMLVGEVVVLCQLYEINLWFDNVIIVIEVVLFDLFGQYFDVLVVVLFGEGQQCDVVLMFVYLFYIGDWCCIDLLYCDEVQVLDLWFWLCNEVVFMLVVIVWQVEVVVECYGFVDFKLKGGVMVGVDEMEVIVVIKMCFFDVCMMFDLNGVWLFDEVVVLCCG